MIKDCSFCSDVEEKSAVVFRIAQMRMDFMSYFSPEWRYHCRSCSYRGIQSVS